MMLLKDENEFQEWVMARFAAAGGHVCDHRNSATVAVPDLSAALRGIDYWLELKHGGNFKLLHNGRRYQRFELRETQRRQVDWLQLRAMAGNCVCGILAYFTVSGDHTLDGEEQPYIFFMNTDDYLNRLVRGEMDAGAVVLSRFSTHFDKVKTCRDLTAFIRSAGGAERVRQR